MHNPSSRNGVILRIQNQIADAKEKIERINATLLSDPGTRFENTLDAVYADDIRTYWEKKIKDLEALLETYQEFPDDETTSVQDGDRIRLIKLGTTKVQEYTLSNRVDLFTGERCISTSSPIGRAVVNKSVGETVSVITPQGKMSYRILARYRE